MLGVYFSGTGNTKYVLNLFLKNLGQTYSISSIEDKDTLEKIKKNKDIVIAHPIHYSCIPKIFRDFLDNNIELFRDKNIFIITTMGLFGQRLYFKHKVKDYSNNLKFDKEKCTKCGKCTKACPMNNLKIEESIKQLGKCTMCYRCLNLCPNEAITLIGKKVIQQHNIKEYI